MAAPPYKFVSIGAGNCDIEIDIAKTLIEMGLVDFTIECLEINTSMTERGRAQADNLNLSNYIKISNLDFNDWKPTEVYNSVMANHSLHHVVNLEGLFESIKASLHPSGYFVTNDMIGRNGHQKWPEALSLLNQFWNELPQSYRYNRLLKRDEPTFINHDCSSEGFEGIRAQDILPLLVDNFQFKVFVGFANVIGPFYDRCFGHHFDPNNPEDCEFIDRVHLVDEDGFKKGYLKPTQMLSVMSISAVSDPFYSRGLTPEFCVRVP